MAKISKNLMLLISILVGVVYFSSCEKYTFRPPVLNPVDTIHFQNEVQPIFNTNCISCHDASFKPDLRSGKSYESLTKGGYVIQPGETSKLYLKMTSSSHIARSSDTDKQKVLLWINQGALNN